MSAQSIYKQEMKKTSGESGAQRGLLSGLISVHQGGHLEPLLHMWWIPFKFKSQVPLSCSEHTWIRLPGPKRAPGPQRLTPNLRNLRLTCGKMPIIANTNSHTTATVIVLVATTFGTILPIALTGGTAS